MKNLKHILFATLLTTSSLINAQTTISDNFADGDFTNNPAWSGDVADFQVVGGELVLNASGAGESYLSTPSTIADDATWTFTLKIDNTTSSSNFSDFILMSNTSDLSGDFNGYFVRMGGTADEVALFQKTAGVETQIIDGVDKQIGQSGISTVAIKVTRSSAGVWELLTDITGGTTYVSSGTATDNTHLISNVMGFKAKYSSSRTSNYFLSNLSVTGKAIADTFVPEINSVAASSPTKIIVTFNEATEKTSAETIVNYTVVGSTVQSATQLSSTTVELVLTTILTQDTDVSVTVNGVADISGNTMTVASTKSFRIASTQILSTNVTDNVTVDVVFDNAIDPVSAPILTNYTITGDTVNPTAAVLSLDGKTITLNFKGTSFKIDSNTVYNVDANNLTDANGFTKSYASVAFGFVSSAAAGDILINEFIGSPTKLEFVEIYNNSNKIIDLSTLEFSQRGTDNKISSKGTAITTTKHNMAPGQYRVLHANRVISDFTDVYSTINTSVFLSTSADGIKFISEPDELIIHLLGNDTTGIIDELTIVKFADFHSSKSTTNITIERTSFTGATNSTSNWHSANSAVKGTPGVVNSINFNTSVAPKLAGEITVSDQVFAPREADANLSSVNLGYSFEVEDVTMNIYIFNNVGMMVRHLVKQTKTTALTGQVSWNGQDDFGTILPTGIYTIVMEAFDNEGNTINDRTAVAIGAMIR